MNEVEFLGLREGTTDRVVKCRRAEMRYSSRPVGSSERFRLDRQRIVIALMCLIGRRAIGSH
jgi:hypothetical protein